MSRAESPEFSLLAYAIRTKTLCTGSDIFILAAVYLTFLDFHKLLLQSGGRW